MNLVLLNFVVLAHIPLIFGFMTKEAVIFYNQAFPPKLTDCTKKLFKLRPSVCLLLDFSWNLTVRNKL